LAVVAFNLNGLVDNYQKTVGNSLLGYDLMDRLLPVETKIVWLIECLLLRNPDIFDLRKAGHL
jgi:hypothetical protein